MLFIAPVKYDSSHTRDFERKSNFKCSKFLFFIAYCEMFLDYFMFITDALTQTVTLITYIFNKFNFKANKTWISMEVYSNNVKL